MTTLRLSSRNANQLTFVDPDSFNNTVNVSVNVQPKKAGSRTVHNVNASFNAQSVVTLPKPPGCEDVCMPLDQERLAIRFSLSGSTSSKVEMKKLLTNVKAWITLLEDDMMSGFITDNLVLTTTV